jgi:hypothetical protein
MKQTDLQWEWKEVIRGLDTLQQVSRLAAQTEMTYRNEHAF